MRQLAMVFLEKVVRQLLHTTKIHKVFFGTWGCDDTCCDSRTPLQVPRGNPSKLFPLRLYPFGATGQLDSKVSCGLACRIVQILIQILIYSQHLPTSQPLCSFFSLDLLVLVGLGQALRDNGAPVQPWKALEQMFCVTSSALESYDFDRFCVR